MENLEVRSVPIRQGIGRPLLGGLHTRAALEHMWSRLELKARKTAALLLEEGDRLGAERIIQDVKSAKIGNEALAKARGFI